MGLRVRVPVCVVKLVFWWSADTPTPSQATGVWRTEWRTSIRFPHHIPSASHSRPSASPSASPTGKHTHDSETFTFKCMHLTDTCIQSDLQARLYIFFVSMCVPWELNPQPFALLTQRSTTEPQELEPCKPVGSRHTESIRAGFGLFLFFDRSGSDRTRAHLAYRLLLCPNTRKPHMYCMKYCYNNYIINIIHRLCNRQLRNAYTQALAYRWQLTMQSIREKLERGELLKVPNASGKAAFWQRFVCINICGHDCRWW